ncbi:hypothetical protein BCR39DRAFT_342435 [Naematelia encephala]|uniref:Telomeric single stranded DNA binding POT1/Cdc13 domain-containing protein n=1 Tax=Naematelia encephala TaxID=71784 RepID=A0A1Y2ANC8_9TREE|nr:hypothetical protein BCR39DRAFT_342435 [Naematelia encephala]
MFRAGNILPSDTWISGTLFTVYGSVHPKEGDGPRLGFILRCQLPESSASFNDYTVQDDKNKIARFSVTVFLRTDGVASKDQTESMEEDRKVLLALNGKALELDCSDLKVVSVSTSGKGIDVKLEGRGERIAKTANRSFKLLSAPITPSTVPSWYNSTATDVSSSPQALIAPPSAVNPLPVPRAGTIRLLPLSAHGFPAFLPPAPKKISPQVTATTVPYKRSSEETEPLKKKVRIDPHTEERTIFALAPPNAVPPVWTDRSASPSKDQSVLAQPAVEAVVGTSDTLQSSIEAPTPAQRVPRLESSGGDDLEILRKGAEEEAREEAEAKRAEREKASEVAQRDLDRLMRGFECNGIPYVTLNNLTAMVGQVANVFGIVVGTQPPKHIGKSGDYMMSVVIADPTTHDEGHASNDIVVTVFRKTEADLPVNVLPGTPILFRGLRISKFNDKPKGQAFTPAGTGASSTNTWATLPGGKTLKLADPRHMYPPVAKAELDRLTALLKWWRSTEGQSERPEITSDDRRVSIGSSRASSPVKQGQVLLQDVQPYTFVDLIFKIMHVVRNTHPRPELELFVSDGTITSQFPRNFHNIDVGIPAQSLFCLAIHKKPPASEEPIFQTGNVVKMPNVRVKEYQGGIELIWSEQVTMDQAQAGWNRRRATQVSPSDERAKVIESRLKMLKQGGITNAEAGPSRVPRSPSPVPQDLGPTVSAPDKIATHLWTVNTDEIDHPLSTIPEILANKSVVNKYRVKARVKSLHARGIKGVDGFVQTYCRHCKRR